MEKETFDEWWKENSSKIYWYKYRLIMGLDPENTNNIAEMLHWKKVNSQREKCLKSNNPEYAIFNASYFDKQYFLEKWWDKLDFEQKKNFLIHVWENKGDGNLYGFDWWIPYFEEMGFIKNIDNPAPVEPVILYRGSEPLFKEGMSWTTSLDMAEVFAYQSIELMGEKKVYKTTVEPKNILAMIKTDILGYRTSKLMARGIEYVVDHRELQAIEEV